MADELTKSIQTGDSTFLKGSLSLTNVTDLLQFLSSSYKSGMLQLIKQPGDEQGKIFFVKGELIHVASDYSKGLEGFADILTWENGTFQFYPDALPPEKNVGLTIQHAIMEAVILLDEKTAKKQNEDNPITHDANTSIEKRSGEMSRNERDSAEIMNDLLGIPGIDAVVVIGRDGFVIESAGSSTRVNIDELGASLAHAVNGIEEMGSELKVDKFQDMFIEYGRAVILCKPVGDAVAAVITPDASKLGIIRHKTKKHLEELAQSF